MQFSKPVEENAMREVSLLPSRRTMIFFLLLTAAFLLVACRSNRLQPATLALMDEAEAAWMAAPTASYRITVEIDRPGDRRRSTVTVVDHEISEGTVSYWDFEAKRWQPAYALNDEQSFPFSVPGLFDMVRGALEESGRESIYVMMEGEPPFPQKILFGPVVVDGVPFDQTKSTVTVREFERQ